MVALPAAVCCARQQGVPFIGIDKDKPAARVEHELRLIFLAGPSRSLGTFQFGSVMKDPALEQAVARVFTECGVMGDEPGATQTVVFELGQEDLGFTRRDMTWGAEPGEFTVWMGSSAEGGLEGSFVLYGSGHGCNGGGVRP